MNHNYSHTCFRFRSQQEKAQSAKLLIERRSARETTEHETAKRLIFEMSQVLDQSLLPNINKVASFARRSHTIGIDPACTKKLKKIGVDLISEQHSPWSGSQMRGEYFSEIR
jgi:hypothetical protein